MSVIGHPRLHPWRKHFGEDGDVGFAFDDGAETVRTKSAFNLSDASLDNRIYNLVNKDCRPKTFVSFDSANSVNFTNSCIGLVSPRPSLFYAHNLLPDMKIHRCTSPRARADEHQW